MALSEFEHKRCVDLLEGWLEKRRPPLYKRAQLDYGYTIHNQTIELLEIRPLWDRPMETKQRPFARMTFVRTQNHWKVYWMMSNGKWCAHDPATFERLEDVLEDVELDEMGCFYG